MSRQTTRPVLRRGHQHLAAGTALHLGHPGGDLSVMAGSVWLTRDHDLGDHFILPGQQVQLAAGENAVIEPAPGYRGASVHWTPEPHGFARSLLADRLRGTAFLAGLAAYGLMALARRAAATANRIQGGTPHGRAIVASPGRQCVRVNLDVGR